MKSICLSAAILFFAALFTVPTMAQTASASGTSKIAIIDSSKFADPKVGVTKYLQAGFVLKPHSETDLQDKFKHF